MDAIGIGLNAHSAEADSMRIHLREALKPTFFVKFLLRKTLSNKLYMWELGSSTILMHSVVLALYDYIHAVHSPTNSPAQDME